MGIDETLIKVRLCSGLKMAHIQLTCVGSCMQEFATTAWYICVAVQVAEHAELKVAIHHGTSRELDPQALANFDVVITSYGTLLSGHKQSTTDGLFG